MSPSQSTVTQKANKATAADLALSVLPTQTLYDRNFSFSVKATPDLGDDERDQIWGMFEENMHELYRSSTFGWEPQTKKKEMFDALSRFVLARPLTDATRMQGPKVIAYSIFRFEREDRQNVVYCYELQVSKDSRRFGLGRLLTQMLFDIGAQWGMSKVMLTVFKANQTAMSFYKSMGFDTDETSPEFSEDEESWLEEECDYTILSRGISRAS